MSESKSAKSKPARKFDEIRYSFVIGFHTVWSVKYTNPQAKNSVDNGSVKAINYQYFSANRSSQLVSFFAVRLHYEIIQVGAFAKVPKFSTVKF